MTMTIEEAIEYFELFSDRAERKAVIFEKAYPPFQSGFWKDKELFDIAIAALRAQQERENPKPLTLEELREMHGEPVWVQSPDLPKYGRWAIVEGVDIDAKILYLKADCTCHDYGKVWLAYRYKPGEVTKC